jgi:HEAT repeat protein
MHVRLLKKTDFLNLKKNFYRVIIWEMNMIRGLIKRNFTTNRIHLTTLEWSGKPTRTGIRFRTAGSCKNRRFYLWLIFFFLPVIVPAQSAEDSRREIIKFGTETEVASLIQILRTENVDYLDNDLINLLINSRNQRVLTGVFNFFGERAKSGLEERAMKAITQREDETNETILSALDYLGKVKSKEAVPVIMELLDTEERRFLNAGFRAIGQAASGDKKLADETAEFLIDYYNDRDPGNDNRSVVIGAIGETGSAEGISFLVDIATNTDERVPLRIAALGALSKIGDEKGLEAILTCVGTNDPNVRSSAVGALGPFKGDAVDNAILDAFRDSYYRTRIAASQASRDRKLAKAVPYLKFRAERDEVPNVKDEAIRALGAIVSEESLEVLLALFSERKNADRVRILAADMLIKNSGGKDINKLIVELEEAKRRSQTKLYNGFLRVTGEAVIEGNKSEAQRIAAQFMRNGTVIEKLYGLDIAGNNKLDSLSEEIIVLTKDKNESLARKARRIAGELGIELPSE